ncbi:MAG: response regulator [Chloroflexi bacterium]|nr:response regulator [Chloroflexota bacterium]
MSNSAEDKNGSIHLMRVLIADDVMETRRSTRLMMTLVSDAKVVATAENGREAVQMARKYQPDVVLMDVNMPEMNGLQAIEVIRQHRPETACIVLSAERGKQTLREAMALGAQDYLIKPFTSDQLLVVMQRAREHVVSNRWATLQAEKQRQEQEKELRRLAEEYIKTRRTDGRAMAVFEKLATNPDCDIRYLRTLAIIYVFRQQWRRLKYLAHHLEQRTKQARKNAR